jgi:hypothetical protein
VTPTSVTAVSATELRVVHPVLAAGAYPVRMRNAQGAIIDRSSARLFVTSSPTYVAETLAYPGTDRRRINSLVYDAERRMLLVSAALIRNNVISPANNELLRYTYTTSWSAAAPGGLRPELDVISLSTDGSRLLLGSAPFSSTATGRIDLFSADMTTGFGSVNTRSGGLLFSSMAATSTGEQLLIEGSNFNTGPGFRAYRYQTRTNTLVELPFAQLNDLSQGAVVATSGNGLRGLIYGNINNTASIYEYDSSTGNITRASLAGSARQVSLDRTGDRVASGNFGSELVRIYSRNWTLLGTLPTTTIGFLISPNGQRAYTFDVDRKVHVFDLTANAAGGAYPELGTGLTPAGDPGTTAEFVRLALTPDARTLFLAGDTRIAVVPLP